MVLMQGVIKLNTKKVEYTLRISTRVRSVRLSVASGGVFTVTVPSSVRPSVVREFVNKKADWVIKKITYLSQFPRRQHKGKPIGGKKHFLEHKHKALALVRERLAHFNRDYTFRWNRITIRNQRSRWGSCSQRGNLSFNYRIALLPPHLSDYIIVHELCHLRELNHSRAFWTLVARTCPTHQELRGELRKVGVSLV